MDAGFTKGPWSYAPAVPGAKRSFYIAGNNAEHNRQVDIGTVQGGFNSCEANARLIAAAPDLFEALKPFVDWYNIREHQRGLTGGPKHDDDTPIFMAASIEGEVLITLGALRRARAALLKATGETK